PEILIVDEVLAVGDAQFQAKCLGKMDEVSRREGRTILFVSHNMSAVRKLCSAAVVVSGGTVSFKGAVAEGVAHYLVEETESVGGWRRRHPLPDRPGIYFREVRICGADGATRAHFDPGETFTVEMRVAVTGAFARPQLSLRFTNLEGVAAFCTCSTDHAGRFLPFEPGERTFRVTLDAGYLMPGRYALHLGAHLPRDRGFDQVDHQLSIEIGSVGSLTTLFGDERPGVVLPVIEWRERP
ncbi:MAG: Wzt carbohydrate-binding domain-containing protein, partial [Verrucomicrobiota bacterium]